MIILAVLYFLLHHNHFISFHCWIMQSLEYIFWEEEEDDGIILCTRCWGKFFMSISFNSIRRISNPIMLIWQLLLYNNYNMYDVLWWLYWGWANTWRLNNHYFIVAAHQSIVMKIHTKNNRKAFTREWRYLLIIIQSIEVYIQVSLSHYKHYHHHKNVGIHM